MRRRVPPGHSVAACAAAVRPAAVRVALVRSAAAGAVTARRVAGPVATRVWAVLKAVLRLVGLRTYHAGRRLAGCVQWEPTWRPRTRRQLS